MTGAQPGGVHGDGEPIGSAAEEAVKLLRALATGGRSQANTEDEELAHECPNGWCPVCRVADWVRENPEIVEGATDSAIAVARTLRDGLDAFLSARDRDPGSQT